MMDEKKPAAPEESSVEKMPPPQSRQEQATIEKAEETKLRAKYPQANKPMLVGGPGSGAGGGGHSAFLQKRLGKGQKYFDSGDYQMAKQKGPRGVAGRLVMPVMSTPPTGDTIPTPDSVPARKSSIIQPLHDHTRSMHVPSDPAHLHMMAATGTIPATARPKPNPAITKLAS
jgi:hypothetical protein